jgi:hypothetical protein
MTTTWQSETHRGSRDAFRKPARPPLEMPVLFQLADLSGQQIKSAPLPSVSALAAPSAPVVEPVFVPEPPAAEPVQEPVRDEPLQPAVLKFEALDPEPVVSEEPQAKSPASEIRLETRETEAKVTSSESAPAIEMLSTPTAKETESETESSSPAPPISDSVTSEVVPPADAAAPTPRERAELRTKSRQAAPPKSDWMRTHGKFIAVGFIIALIATIYTAQNGDEPAPANPDSVSASADESADGERESNLTEVPAAQDSIPVVEHQPSGALARDTSPATDAVEAHAELHPPQSGGIVKEPVDVGEVADAKSLFPWKDAAETRVAAKPDDGRAKTGTKPLESAAPPSSEPAPTEARSDAPADAPAEETPSIYGPPSSSNREPVGEPAGGAPELNAPTTYPVTNPSSFRIHEPPQARPNVGQTRATPASYDHVPPPRTSGPRHERTGSGLY